MRRSAQMMSGGLLALLSCSPIPARDPAPPCASDRSCPSGYLCGGDDLCHRGRPSGDAATGVDAAPLVADDAALPPDFRDAPLDAPSAERPPLGRPLDGAVGPDAALLPDGAVGIDARDGAVGIDTAAPRDSGLGDAGADLTVERPGSDAPLERPAPDAEPLNLIANPTFDDDLFGWTSTSSSPMTRVTPGRTGTGGCLQLGKGTWAQARPITFEGGATYELSGWGRSSGGSCSIGLISGSDTSQNPSVSAPVFGLTWGRRSLSFTPLDGTAWAFVDAYSAGDVECQVDDLALVKVSGP